MNYVVTELNDGSLAAVEALPFIVVEDEYPFSAAAYCPTETTANMVRDALNAYPLTAKIDLRQSVRESLKRSGITDEGELEAGVDLLMGLTENALIRSIAEKKFKQS